MDGVVIDERRVHVDFSQSVAKLWYNFKKAQNMSRAEDKNNELKQSKAFEKSFSSDVSRRA